MARLTEEERARLDRVSTTNLSDAMDKLGIHGAAWGIRPVWGAPKIVGNAVTVKITAAGETKSKTHLGSAAIDSAEKGDIILVDNGGRPDVSCWGGILANGARMRGVSGVIVDGACRDADEYLEMDFPVFARGVVPMSARGRIIQESYNTLIQIGGVQVRPGDVVLADANGVAVIPAEKFESVLAEAEKLLRLEEQMVAEVKAGASMLEVDEKFGYERMLNK